jgi:hypothetical protein
VSLDTGLQTVPQRITNNSWGKLNSSVGRMIHYGAVCAFDIAIKVRCVITCCLEVESFLISKVLAEFCGARQHTIFINTNTCERTIFLA